MHLINLLPGVEVPCAGLPGLSAAWCCACASHHDAGLHAQCIQPFVQNLEPAVALGYLLDVQYQISFVLQPDLAFVSGNLTSLVVCYRSYCKV